MALNILQALECIKGNVAAALAPEMIREVCRELGHRWRERELDPVTTVYGFLLQILHGNTACEHVPHLLGRNVTGDAYCQARGRLPVELFQRLLAAVCRALDSCVNDAARWCGHRVWLMDGSSCSMPDTPELQRAFGQPGGQACGCGFPVAHLLTLFHASTGFLLRIVAAPLRTHDLAHAALLHGELRAGDVLLADRGFCSYAHLALLSESGIHGVFRIHQKTIVSFRRGRSHQPMKRRCNKKSSPQKGRPSSAWVRSLGPCDQLVRYFRPSRRPSWMAPDAFALLPESLLVRELRYRIQRQGSRTREVMLVTTLLDPETYTATDLADLYRTRWDVETNLRHLKQTLRMDVLKTKTARGISKELAMFALVYNLVRWVMCGSGREQSVAPNRISFIDALRWLCRAGAKVALGNLVVVRLRPGRLEPRVRKRRPKQYPVMKRPRDELRQTLLAQ
ncbi:MAG: IS4 family transposase [Pirellulaceae bacterium]